MSISWTSSSAKDLREHHARDAAEQAGDLPADVDETLLAPRGTFRGGLLFTPRKRAGETVIVYFHGGGFVAGSPETHRCVTAWLAKLSGLRVLSARYRLAPEHLFPAQRDDAVAACDLALGLGGGSPDLTGLVLAGDSAGACVALWAWRSLDQKRQAARIRGLVLFYGGFGHITSASIARSGTSENGLDSRTLIITYGRLGDTESAPVSIWPKDFARQITAPAYILASELDPVFDDSAKLFQGLRGNAAESIFVVAEGQNHGFFKSTGKDPVAMRELEKAARWIAGLPAATNEIESASR
ncbi:MAG: alpha/beta hydrolase fold domain-containing protein [Dongiaceae bacterium]